MTKFYADEDNWLPRRKARMATLVHLRCMTVTANLGVLEKASAATKETVMLRMAKLTLVLVISAKEAATRRLLSKEERRQLVVG